MVDNAIYVFDAYGTLLDVHSAVRRVIGDSDDAARLSDVWRQKQLEYTWVHTLMKRYVDFWQLTAAALDYARQKVPLIDEGQATALLAAYRALDCYSEVPKVLTELANTGHPLAVLSNGTPQMLAEALQAAKIHHLFDQIMSVDDLKAFKTDPAVYMQVTAHYRCAPDQVKFCSSNRWDIAGASAFGFDGIWINRTGQPDEYLDFPPGQIRTSLAGI
jgi:2-haloacid dehalogenase